MKVEVEDATFRPITITLESRDEAEALWAVINHSKIADFLRDNGLDTSELLDLLPGNQMGFRELCLTLEAWYAKKKV